MREVFIIRQNTFPIAVTPDRTTGLCTCLGLARNRATDYGREWDCVEPIFNDGEVMGHMVPYAPGGNRAMSFTVDRTPVPVVPDPAVTEMLRTALDDALKGGDAQ